MSNQVNNQRFYMFLSSFETNGGWVSHADQDGDNYIMQCEFYDFVKKNWDGENTPSPDLINKFWNNLDSNKDTGKIKGTTLRNLNALDKKEMEKLQKNLASYVIFDTFFGQGGPVETEKNFLKTTGVLKDASILNQWKGAIKDRLAALFANLINENPDISEDEVHSALNNEFNNIKDAITAEYIQAEQFKTLMDTILRGFDYNPNEDFVLNALIENYINQALADLAAGKITMEDIKKGIINIINQYLKQAGIEGQLPGGDNVDNIKEGDNGYIGELGDVGLGTTANNLQVAKLIHDQKEKIKNKVNEILEVKGITSTKHDYCADTLKLFTEQIIEIKDSMSYEELKAKIEAFDYTAIIINLVEFDIGHDDFSETSTFYSDVEEAFDTNFADYLASNDIYSSVYTDIIAQAREMYINGGFSESMDSYIITQIKKRFPEFYPSGMSSREDIATLNSIYNNFVKSGEAVDTSSRAERVFDAALMYCNALVEKNPMYYITIKSVLGSVDYKNVLESSSISDITEIMENLTTEALTAHFSDPFSGIDSSYFVFQDDELTLSLPTFDGANYSTSGIFDLNPGSNIVIANTSKAGDTTNTINLVVDGVVVASKTIKVKVEPSPVYNVQNWDGQALPDVICCGYQNNQPVTNVNFKDLYNNSAVIQLYFMDDGDCYFNDAAKGNLKHLIRAVVAALCTAGLNRKKLEEIGDKVFDTYCNKITTIECDDEVDNNDYDGMRKYVYAAENRHNGGILRSENKNAAACNEVVYSVSFRDLVDAILKEYYAAYA